MVLPDEALAFKAWVSAQESQCTYRCVVLPDASLVLTAVIDDLSQCTYRCVVLPDIIIAAFAMTTMAVSMHLQVRGAP